MNPLPLSKISFRGLSRSMFGTIHYFWPKTIYRPPNKDDFSQSSSLFLSFLTEINSFINYPPPRRAEFLSNVKPIFSAIHHFWAKSNVFINPPLEEEHFSQISFAPSRAYFWYYPFLTEINKLHRWAEFLSNNLSTCIFSSTEYPPFLTEIIRFHRSPKIQPNKPPRISQVN